MRKFYTVKDVALMSGLTERTIRSYMRMGFLNGTKSEGVWKFDSEEVDAFFQHSWVLSSIQSKRTGLVSDFLANRSITQNRMCAILDLPMEDHEKAYGCFLRILNDEHYKNAPEFYYEDFEGCPRIILIGSVEDVLSIMNKYQATAESGGNRNEV